MDKISFSNPIGEFYQDKIISKNSNNAYLTKMGELPVIKFKCFEEFSWLKAFMTTRLGGVSTGHLSSLNLGYDRGDIPENVDENYRRLKSAIDLEPLRIIKLHQVHGTDVYHITGEMDFEKLWENPMDGDGMYTGESGIALCVSAADCVPIFLVNKKTRDIAAVHSGWRGTVARIAGTAVSKLLQSGDDPGDIVALIGPSISGANYEVTSDVVKEFLTNDFNKCQMNHIATKTDEVHFHVDLWAANFYVLNDAGVKKENIYFSNVCTYENHDLLFSHRYSKGNRGNQMGVMTKGGQKGTGTNCYHVCP